MLVSQQLPASAPQAIAPVADRQGEMVLQGGLRVQRSAAVVLRHQEDGGELQGSVRVQRLAAR